MLHKSPKVLYSHDIFSTQYIGGISRYIFELFIRNDNATIPLVYSENLYLNRYKKRTHFKGKIRIIRLINELKERIILQNIMFDIYHISYYKRTKIPQSTAFIVTIHDMIHEIYADSYFKNDAKTSKLKRLNCQNADGIIAISQQTKRDLIEIFGISENKIRVIYQAHSLKKPNFTISLQHLPKDYILFVGTRSGYKNFINFAKAMVVIYKHYPHIKALCVGSEFSDDESDFLESLGIKNIFITHLATESELYHIYKNALCFVFPSLYEGFGIPILEAFFTQTPILLSDINIFREIAKEAAFYFNPHDINAIAGAISQAINDIKLTQRKVALATKRLADFSWDKTYKQTLEFYSEILAIKRGEISVNIKSDSADIVGDARIANGGGQNVKTQNVAKKQNANKPQITESYIFILYLAFKDSKDAINLAQTPPLSLRCA